MPHSPSQSTIKWVYCSIKRHSSHRPNLDIQCWAVACLIWISLVRKWSSTIFFMWPPVGATTMAPLSLSSFSFPSTTAYFNAYTEQQIISCDSGGRTTWMYGELGLAEVIWWGRINRERDSPTKANKFVIPSLSVAVVAVALYPNPSYPIRVETTADWNFFHGHLPNDKRAVQNGKISAWQYKMCQQPHEKWDTNILTLFHMDDRITEKTITWHWKFRNSQH